MPFEWVVSRVCDEFHCVPSVAIRELLTAPCGLLDEILELRAFAAAKAEVDRALSDGKDVPDTPMALLVLELRIDEKRARTRQRRAADVLDGGDE